MPAKTTSERIAEAFRAGTPVDRAIARAVRQAAGRSKPKAKSTKPSARRKPTKK